MAKLTITLGSNQSGTAGTPSGTLINALRLFESESLHVISQSSWYQSPAFPAGAGPDFVNAVVLAETAHSAFDVLAALHRIEARLGRVRLQRWAARTCDLDLLDVDGLVVPDMATYKGWQELPLDQQIQRAPDQLILPHPRIQDRAFVLVPLREIAPDWRHPVLNLTPAQMIAKLPQADIDNVRMISA
ncbi:MAG: 2-amino-4-hydroxy-6-hydroxymethyldihydropteridine diphosphokinase [Rhodobacteraceae bacterium]|nr:2-amino-4-hydroxy-6-hydroxymethyldihydropteridine diphosphokinase [Paracoccaceae bacterium]